MGKIYNIVLNSGMGTADATNGTREINYFYDFSTMEEGNYKVTFSFLTSFFTTTNSTVCNVFLDLGQNSQMAKNQSNSNSQKYPNLFLGFLRYSGTGASQHLFADNITNAPVYLNQKPKNNNIKVLLLNNNANQDAYTSGAITITNYSLILNFEKIDE
jgi:hypothetical protein